jgi:hypothetical protein
MGISPTNPGQSPASCRRLEERDSLDLLRENITTILWATGYAYDYGWVSVPVFDDGGRPVQNRGVTQVPGLYFLGLHWMHTFKSRLFLQRRQRRGVPRGTHGSHDGAVTTWPTVPLRSSYGQAFLLLRSTQLGSRNVEAGAVRRAAAFAGFASLSQRGHQTTGTDDDQERGARLLLRGKGTVLAHRLARPLAAESDDDRQCCERGNAPHDFRSGIGAIALVSPRAPRSSRPAVARDPRARSASPRRESCPSCCSIALVDVGRRRPCPDSTPVVRRATRACATRRIRRRSRRSSRSCAPPATARTAGGCAA